MFGTAERVTIPETDTMEERSIRIELAGRAYPLTIHPDEEENIRAAAQEINESITVVATTTCFVVSRDSAVAVETCVKSPASQLAVYARTPE